MNKGELVDAIAKDAKITKGQAADALDAVITAIEKTLSKADGKVTLVGFGTFSVAKRAARTGRNPRTGKEIKIKAKKVAKFKAGAELAKKVVAAEYPEKPEIGIVTTESNDNRSYHINSDKIARVIGFRPKHTIEDAVRDLCKAFKAGKLTNSFTDDIYYNVKRMKRLGIQ